MFFSVDDQLQVNPKALALARRTLSGDLMGPAALGVWLMAGSAVQAQLTDGVISLETLLGIFLDRDFVERAASLLCEVGLWHGSDHKCDRCQPVAPGTWRYHDWFDLGYDTGEGKKLADRKKKELKDRNLIDSVWARDRIPSGRSGRSDVALCRYCGKKLRKNVRRGPDGWELDHVDPNRAIGARNVVVACRDCNAKKGRRLPQDAGLKLRRPPSGLKPDDPYLLLAKMSVDSVAEPDQGSPIHAQDAAADTAPVCAVDSVAEPVKGSPIHAPRFNPATEEFSAPEPESSAPERVPETSTQETRVLKTGSLTSDAENILQQVSADFVNEVSPRARLRARPRTRAWQGYGREITYQGNTGTRQGSPQGDTQGSPQGSLQGAPQGTRQGAAGSVQGDARVAAPQGQSTARKRRRGRRRTSGGSCEVAENLDAGQAPNVLVAGRFGSPWHGWHGPPAEPGISFCEEHEQHWPCRFCQEQAEEEHENS